MALWPQTPGQPRVLRRPSTGTPRSRRPQLNPTDVVPTSQRVLGSNFIPKQQKSSADPNLTLRDLQGPFHSRAAQGWAPSRSNPSTGSSWSLPSWWGRRRAREYPARPFRRRSGRNPWSRGSGGTLALVIRTASGARNDSTPQLMITLSKFTSSLINLLGSPHAQNGASRLREQPQAFAFPISCNWGGAGNGERGTRRSHRAVHLGGE